MPASRFPEWEEKVEGVDASYPLEEIRLSQIFDTARQAQIRALIQEIQFERIRWHERTILGEFVVVMILSYRVDNWPRRIATGVIRPPARIVTFLGAFFVIQGVLELGLHESGALEAINSHRRGERRSLEDIVFFLREQLERAKAGNLNLTDFQRQFYRYLSDDQGLQEWVADLHALPLPPDDLEASEAFENYLRLINLKIAEELHRIEGWLTALEAGIERRGESDEIVYDLRLPFSAEEHEEFFLTRYLLNRFRGPHGRRLWLNPQEKEQIRLELEAYQQQLQRLAQTYRGLEQGW